MKQLAAVSAREYLFTNNPLITSDGQWDQTPVSTQELALNEIESEQWRRKPFRYCKKKKTFAGRTGGWGVEGEWDWSQFQVALFLIKDGRLQLILGREEGGAVYTSLVFNCVCYTWENRRNGMGWDFEISSLWQSER